MSKDIQKLPYRSGVGICLFNKDGLVFVGERLDTRYAWQMPQGGIDKGEDITKAALRELKEEIGTDKAKIIRIIEEKIRYELPPELQQRLWRGKYRGQEQTWVAAKFLGTDADININADEKPEFGRWQWVPIEKTIELIVPFKRDTYRQVVEFFRDLAIG
jgi:putative (di)nucleoside polyphosphate hydrolase